MKEKLYTLIIICITMLLTASCGADHYMKKGEKYLALGEYYDAAAEFKTAYNKTSPKDKDKRGERAKKLAGCYDRINSTQKAIAAYRNTIRYNKADIETHLSFARVLMKTAAIRRLQRSFSSCSTHFPTTNLPRPDCCRHRHHKPKRKPARDI